MLLQVVDTFATWRQRVANDYYGGDMERCMRESGTGGVKLLLLSFMDQEYARPGEISVCLRKHIKVRIYSKNLRMVLRLVK